MNAVCSCCFSLVRFVVSKIDLTVAVSCGANLLVVKFGSFLWISFYNAPTLIRGALKLLWPVVTRFVPIPVGVPHL